ncbi:MAG: hypothetical protein DHS80DRAFT_25440 [Piptocephalis tieghemiana]|nr:MAG: hypothetical protein DHS80DRAFT_25440 [Piptocephalis tieghemiana]
MNEDTIKPPVASSYAITPGSTTTAVRPTQKTSNSPCFFFQKGKCFSGDQCVYRHILSQGKGKKYPHGVKDQKHPGHGSSTTGSHHRKKTKPKTGTQGQVIGAGEGFKSKSRKPTSFEASSASLTSKIPESRGGMGMAMGKQGGGRTGKSIPTMLLQTQGSSPSGPLGDERPPSSPTSPSVRMGRPARRCYLFQKGRCAHGDKCKYPHILYGTSASTPSSPISSFDPSHPHLSMSLRRKSSIQSMDLPPPAREPKVVDREHGRQRRPQKRGQDKREAHGTSQPSSPISLHPPSRAQGAGIRKGSYDSRVEALLTQQYHPSTVPYAFSLSSSSSSSSSSYSIGSPSSPSSAADASSTASSEGIFYSPDASSSSSSSSSSDSPSTPSNLPAGWPKEWKMYGEPVHQIPFALTATYRHLMSEEDGGMEDLSFPSPVAKGGDEVRSERLLYHHLTPDEPSLGEEETGRGGSESWRRRVSSSGPNLQAVSEGEALLLMQDSLPNSPEMQRHARVVLLQHQQQQQQQQQQREGTGKGAMTTGTSSRTLQGIRPPTATGGRGGKGHRGSSGRGDGERGGRAHGEEMPHHLATSSHIHSPHPSPLPPSLSLPPLPDQHHHLDQGGDGEWDARMDGTPMSPRPPPHHLHGVLTSAQQLLWELEGWSQREPWRREVGTTMHRLAQATDHLIGDFTSLEQRCEEQQRYIQGLEHLLAHYRMD